jgi:hypothetical protein
VGCGRYKLIIAILIFRIRGINEVVKKKCEMTHCVNNLDGYCQSKVSKWLGICRFKRKPEADEA